MSTNHSNQVACHHFESGRCRSCQHLEHDVTWQQQHRQALVRAALKEQCGHNYPIHWGQAAPIFGFRNKAKVAVGSSSYGRIRLGFPQRAHKGFTIVDNHDCPLHLPLIQKILLALKEMIGRFQITPYDINRQVGELKYLIVQCNQAQSEAMVRLVVRSREEQTKLQALANALKDCFRQIQVITLNYQPLAKAIIEGEEEEILHAPSESSTVAIHEQLGAVHYLIGPQSFWQVNSVVAQELYETVAAQAQEIAPATVVDLFCGVGGFSLAIKARLPKARIFGHELSAQAVALAQAAVQRNQFEAKTCSYQVTDLLKTTNLALELSAEGPVDLMVVNPPRRGVGPAVLGAVAELRPRYLIYSSCNSTSLASDLAALTKFGAHYQLQTLNLFDLFPHTDHCESLALLKLI